MIAATWQSKCCIDNLKALLPFQQQLRRLKDAFVPYRRIPGRDTLTIRDGLRMIHRLGEFIRGSHILEVGAGWQPIHPVLYSLAGAARVYTADLHRLLRPATLDAAMQALRENADEICRRLPLNRSSLDHATRPVTDLEGRLEELRITYLAPCDCTRMPLPAASLDVITSRAVLEHIPPDVV